MFLFSVLNVHFVLVLGWGTVQSESLSVGYLQIERAIIRIFNFQKLASLRFVHSTPAFDTPVRGVPSDYCHGV